MKKLYRSKVNRIIAGVCGGLGEFFGITPVFFRLLFLFIQPLTLIYILMWIYIPENPNQKFAKASTSPIKFILTIILACIIFAIVYTFMKSYLGIQLF